MTLQRIREGLGSNAPGSRSMAVRIAMRLVFAAYFFVFLSDTLNLDVLAASLRGRIHFVDDAAISDSLFDSGNTVHQSVFNVHYAVNDHVRFANRAVRLTIEDQSKLNNVYEDEDSPGIEDAHSSSSVVSDIMVPLPQSDKIVLTTPISFDRIITFGQILI